MPFLGTTAGLKGRNFQAQTQSVKIFTYAHTKGNEIRRSEACSLMLNAVADKEKRKITKKSVLFKRNFSGSVIISLITSLFYNF